jgi:hypothetical protein
MEASTTLVDRSGQKETLVIARTELDHVRHALKGLHIICWMPRAYPEGDRTSPKCAIDIQFPPHSEETRNGPVRRVKVFKGTLCIQPTIEDEVSWVWGETQAGARLGRPPAK